MEKRDRILAAAARLFQENGFSGVSVREIGEAAGLGASAVSYYFGSKAALYRSIFPEEGDLSLHGGKERIYRSAVRLFAADGYERVSIRDIAREAGVGSAAISYYFGGKAELYKAVLYEGTALISEFVQIIDREKPAPEEIIHLYGRFLCRLGRENPEVLRLIFWELVHCSDVFSEFVQQRLSMVMDIVRQAVQDGICTGRFRKDLSAEEVCISWAGMVLFFFMSEGIHKALAPERVLTADLYMEQAWKLFEEGIVK